MSEAVAGKLPGIYSFTNVFKFVFLSLTGVLLFFTPVTINGVNTIPLDHLITFIHKTIPLLGPVFTLAVILVGGVLPWVQKTYKKSGLNLGMSILRSIGIPFGVIGFLDYTGIASIGPEWLMEPGMLPFLFQKVIMAVTMIVPLGSIFLTLIIGFGFLEFIGVIVRPIMKPVFKVPGKAAIDAVASFVGSFSVAIFLTNKLYNESKYTKREAMIIMTGFSTVSATFMIIVAKTAKLMDHWNFYFWSTLIITFLITAITVRIRPLSRLDNSYVDGEGKPETDMKGNIFKNAIKAGLESSAQSGSITSLLWNNLKGGMKMILVLTPSNASLGVLAFVLVKMTPFFDIVGLICAPATLLLGLIGLPEPLLVAKAATVVLGEMFVPNLIVAGLPLAAKYTIAVTSVSAIIFITGSIPCMLASDIKFKLRNLLLIWYERTILSLLIAGVVGILMFPV